MKPINQCLSPELSKICEQALTTERLNILVNNLLPQNLQPYCFVSAYHRGKLFITTQQAYATELRFMLPALRTQLRTEGKLFGLIQIEIYITDNDISKQKKDIKKTRKVISQQMKETFSSAADVISDPELKLKLMNIISN